VTHQDGCCGYLCEIVGGWLTSGDTPEISFGCNKGSGKYVRQACMKNKGYYSEEIIFQDILNT
jgi:hypothetical protein